MFENIFLTDLLHQKFYLKRVRCYSQVIYKFVSKYLQFCSFICQVAAAMRQRSDVCCLRVKLSPAYLHTNPLMLNIKQVAVHTNFSNSLVWLDREWKPGLPTTKWTL